MARPEDFSDEVITDDDEEETASVDDSDYSPGSADQEEAEAEEPSALEEEGPDSAVAVERGEHSNGDANARAEADRQAEQGDQEEPHGDDATATAGPSAGGPLPHQQADGGDQEPEEDEGAGTPAWLQSLIFIGEILNQAPSRQKRRIVAEIVEELQPEQIRVLALISDKLQQRVRTCQPAPAIQSAKPAAAAVQVPVVVDAAEAAGMSGDGEETSGDGAATAAQPGGGGDSAPGPSGRGRGRAATAAGGTKYPQRTDQRKLDRSADEYAEHTWDRFDVLEGKHVQRGKGALATLGMAADAAQGLKAYKLHAAPVRVLFDLKSTTVGDVHEEYGRAGKLDTPLLNVIERIMVVALSNDTRPMQGEGLSEAQLLPALQCEINDWNKESARWLAKALYNMLGTVREKLPEKLKVGLLAPPTAAAPQASPEAAPATGSGAAGSELDAGGAAAAGAVAAAAGAVAAAAVDGAQDLLQVGLPAPPPPEASPEAAPATGSGAAGPALDAGGAAAAAAAATAAADAPNDDASRAARAADEQFRTDVGALDDELRSASRSIRANTWRTKVMPMIFKIYVCRPFLRGLLWDFLYYSATISTNVPAGSHSKIPSLLSMSNLTTLPGHTRGSALEAVSRVHTGMMKDWEKAARAGGGRRKQQAAEDAEDGAEAAGEGRGGEGGAEDDAGLSAAPGRQAAAGRRVRRRRLDQGEEALPARARRGRGIQGGGSRGGELGSGPGDAPPDADDDGSGGEGRGGEGHDEAHAAGAELPLRTERQPTTRGGRTAAAAGVGRRNSARRGRGIQGGGSRGGVQDPGPGHTASPEAAPATGSGAAGSELDAGGAAAAGAVAAAAAAPPQASPEAASATGSGAAGSELDAGGAAAAGAVAAAAGAVAAAAVDGAQDLLQVGLPAPPPPQASPEAAPATGSGAAGPDGDGGSIGVGEPDPDPGDGSGTAVAAHVPKARKRLAGSEKGGRKRQQSRQPGPSMSTASASQQQSSAHRYETRLRKAKQQEGGLGPIQEEVNQPTPDRNASRKRKAGETVNGGGGASGGSGGGGGANEPMNGDETWEFNKQLAAIAERMADPADLNPRGKRQKEPTLQEKCHQKWGGSFGHALEQLYGGGDEEEEDELLTKYVRPEFRDRLSEQEMAEISAKWDALNAERDAALAAERAAAGSGSSAPTSAAAASAVLPSQVVAASGGARAPHAGSAGGLGGAGSGRDAPASAPVAALSGRALCFFLNKRKVFQQAWINYIALQDIPYENAFQCGCGTHQCDYVIADGILLGVQKDKVHLSKPWMSHDIGARAGSLHKDRVLLDPRASREVLGRLCRPGQRAVTADEYAALLIRIQKRCPELVPYVEQCRGDGVVADAVSRLLSAVASESPVCSFVPGIAHARIQALLLTGQLSPKELRDLARDAPIIGNFIASECSHAAGGRLQENAKQLITRLLAIGKAAYEPASPGNFDKGTAPRAQRDTAARAGIRSGSCAGTPAPAEGAAPRRAAPQAVAASGGAPAQHAGSAGGLGGAGSGSSAPTSAPAASAARRPQAVAASGGARAPHAGSAGGLGGAGSGSCAATSAPSAGLLLLPQAAAVAAAAGAAARRAGSACEAGGAGTRTLVPDSEFLQTGFYYPTLPWRDDRKIGLYAADVRSQRAGAKRCTKYKYDSKNLSPGLFVVHCLDCGGCLGFHMLENAESPRALFEVLYTRWPEAPKVVVYDNNCHAHAYFLNREPQWATNTLFVIDKTHFRGHKGCCKAYDIGSYPKLSCKNSQLAEQRNSKLAILKSHCAYMSQAVFLVYVRYFLYMTWALARMEGQSKV